MSASVSAHDRKSIEEYVIDQIEATGADSDLISGTATFESLGLDSLDVVELSQAVKKDLGIAVTPRDFTEAVAISDAISVICRRAGIA